MKRKIDCRKLVWVNEPKRYLQMEDKIVIETEPFTELKPRGSMAEAKQLEVFPKGNFHFTVRVDFDYEKAFDQCGIVLYQNGKQKAVFGTERRDGEVSKISCIVFYGDGGDKSQRDIGSSIKWMYYRVWVRGKMVNIQYSFNGKRYSDLRQFPLHDKDDTVTIGIYACSPGDSYFDCTFSQLELVDEGEREWVV